MAQDGNVTDPADVFIGGSEMGALMRAFDWSQTSLGSVKTWSQSLKTAVQIMLTSRQAMFVWWGEELINFYNDAYRDILGGKHPTALGLPASQIWHEIWDQVGPRSESAMLKNEGTYDEALLLIMERNGYPEETYYTFSYSPVPNDQGQAGGILCANTDDTQRIVGERQLALLRELAARTADARTFDQACTLSADCLETNPYDFPFALIYLVDPENQRAVLSGMSGIERGHALAPEIIAFDDNSIWPIANLVKSQQVSLISDLDLRFNNLPMGAWPRSPHQVIAMPIAPSGQTGKAGVLVAGLNPFRLFDDSYQGFMALVAAQISASIANAQAYEEERKRAEALAELDQAKTAFFSNVSHEFRTPLTLMLGPLDDLCTELDDRLQPVEREQLQLVQRNGLRLQKLVNTLLDFSRIEAGRVQAFYEPTDLSVYTAELASVFRSLIERAGMRLIIDCPALPEQVYVDREMWEKIVLNLLSNAFKFTLSGSITVRLQSVANSVELTVADTGVGISEAELPQLFERFHRVSGTRARTYEGSGIGLALVQELVKLHGGTIGVTSQLDQGTTFTIALSFGSAHLPSDRIRAISMLPSTATGALPYIEEALRWLPENAELKPQDTTDSQVPISKSLSKSPSSPPARILLADDNADMRDYVKRLLSSEYDVEAVTNGRMALAAMQQQCPDLVLTDVMMPELDGFELLRLLRADPNTQEMPIILLSARAGEEARIEGLTAGADDYLTKPFSARELLARVEATLKLAELRREVKAVIQRSEARSRLAIEIAQLGTWRYDPQTNLAELDQRMCEIWGESETTVKLPLARAIERIHPEDRNRVMSAVVEALRPMSSGAYEVDYRILWDDGTERWLLVNGQVKFEGTGEFRRAVEFLGTALDISDRKQTEAALRESQALFEAFMRYLPATAYIKDAAGRYLYVNSRTERICNRAASELLGKTDFELFSSDDAQQWHGHDHDLAALEVGQAVEVAETFSQADGERHFISYKFPIPQSSGQLLFGGMSLDVTDRHRAEVALRESEEQLRLASEGAELGMWLWDVKSGRLTWTDRAKVMFGLPIDTEMSMQVFLDAVHPDDRPFLQTVITALQSGQTQTEGEYRALWADGTVRWILARGSSSYDADGTLIATRGILIDITERRRTEQALRDSEARFRLMVESAKDYAIFTVDLNGYVTNWNSGAERLLGYTEAEIIGQSGQIIFTAEDRERGRDEQEMHLALTQERAENERWHLRQDGSRFWGSGLVMPLRDETHRIHGFLKIMQDKTAERQAAQALQAGSDRLRLLYETVSELLSTEQPMLLMNTLFHKLSAQIGLHCYYYFIVAEQNKQPMLHLMQAGGISDINAEALEWLEFGQALCGLVALERRQIVLNQSQLLAHPQAQAVCAMGTTAYAGQPLIAQGRLLGTLSFLSRSLTQFSAEEVDLLQAISDQIAVALDRAALVESLQQQKEQLIQANRIKDEFLAVVSHELRSPLNPIVGWSKLLRKQTLDAVKTDYALETIERNAQMLAQLINDLLDISRILQGKLSFNIAPVDLASTIRSAMETVRLAAEAKSIQLHSSFEANLGSVSGDPGRLQQVVWNLLSNAVKFTPPGGRVEIQLQRLDTQAQVTVTDTGKGISPDFLPYVFDYFRQADATTTRKFGGLGLGLAIVRYLVELHGGTVQAESLGEGQGATFTVKLPLIEPPPSITLEASKSQIQNELNGTTVLVVDDDHNTREFTTFLLEMQGANVTAVASASEALAVFTQLKPDILLSDIGMPDMDGYMLIRQVRMLSPEQGGEIPAIALTAYAGEIDCHQAVEAGFQIHLSKPVEPDILIDAIANLVRHVG